MHFGDMETVQVASFIEAIGSELEAGNKITLYIATRTIVSPAPIGR